MSAAPDPLEPTAGLLAPRSHGPPAERARIAAGAALGESMFRTGDALLSLVDHPDDNDLFEAHSTQIIAALRRAAFLVEQFRESRDCAGEG